MTLRPTRTDNRPRRKADTLGVATSDAPNPRTRADQTSTSTLMQVSVKGMHTVPPAENDGRTPEAEMDSVLFMTQLRSTGVDCAGRGDLAKRFLRIVPLLA